MPTQRLYWKDTYLFQTQAQIVAMGPTPEGKTWIRLDQTIAYPQGGGQAADQCTLNGIPVVQLIDHRDLDEIDHIVVNGSTFKIGDVVDVAINPEIRLKNAALHTAGHLVAGVLRRDHSYKDQTGANHLDSKQASVSFKVAGSVTKESLEAEVQRESQKRLPVSERYDDKGTRLIEIEGLHTEPCCGTHVMNTQELSDLALRKVEVDKKGILKAGYSANYNPAFFVQAAPGSAPAPTPAVALQ